MPVDVYRYIVAQSVDKGRQTSNIARCAAHRANVDVFEYIAKNEAQNLNEECLKILPDRLAEACAFESNGARCIQAAIDHNLCNKDDVAREFNNNIESWQQSYLRSEHISHLQKNLAQLVENGYICGSEFCYSVD